jgi:hypothetical protein
MPHEAYLYTKLAASQFVQSAAGSGHRNINLRY